MNEIYLPLYYSWLENTAVLSDEEFGKLIRATIRFAQTGEKEILSPASVNISYNFFTDAIKRATQKSEVAKRNIALRWSAEAQPRQPEPSPAIINTEISQFFENFWKQYPRKTDKQRAQNAFNKLAPDAELMAQMIAAIERQKKSDQWLRDNGRYIPHPATWLNGRRWEDETPDTTKPRLATFDIHDAFDKAIKRTYEREEK